MCTKEKTGPGAGGTEREMGRRQGKRQTEKRNPQETLAVPVDDSPGWPIPVLSLLVHLPIAPSLHALTGGKTRVEVFPVGQADLAIPRNSPDPTFSFCLPSPQEHLLKNKIK